MLKIDVNGLDATIEGEGSFDSIYLELMIAFAAIEDSFTNHCEEFSFGNACYEYLTKFKEEYGIKNVTKAKSLLEWLKNNER